MIVFAAKCEKQNMLKTFIGRDLNTSWYVCTTFIAVHT